MQKGVRIFQADTMMAEGDWEHKSKMGKRAKDIKRIMWVRKTVRAKDCWSQSNKAERV